MMKRKLLLIQLILLVTNLTVIGQETDTSNTNKKLKRGLYMTFEDFKNKTPSQKKSFEVDMELMEGEAWTGTYQAVPSYTRSGRYITKVWGFCDGEKEYIYDRYGFFPIEEANGQFFYWGYGAPEGITGSDVAAVIAFGLVGGLVKHDRNVRNLKEQKQRYIIDMRQGAIGIRERVITERMNLVLYRGARKEQDAKIDIVVADSLNYSFGQNAYHEVSFLISEEPVKVCYGTKADSCIWVSREKEVNKYVKITHRQDKALEVLEVENGVGQYESSIPKKKERKRKKQAEKLKKE